MKRTKEKLPKASQINPKPSKINRKLTLSKEMIAQVASGATHGHCTYYNTGCLPYTC